MLQLDQTCVEGLLDYRKPSLPLDPFSPQFGRSIVHVLRLAPCPIAIQGSALALIHASSLQMQGIGCLVWREKLKLKTSETPRHLTSVTLLLHGNTSPTADASRLQHSQAQAAARHHGPHEQRQGRERGGPCTGYYILYSFSFIKAEIFNLPNLEISSRGARSTASSAIRCRCSAAARMSKGGWPQNPTTYASTPPKSPAWLPAADGLQAK